MLTNIALNLGATTADQWLSYVNIQDQDSLRVCTQLSQYFRALGGGNREAYITVGVNTIQAYGLLTVTGQPTADQTCSILGVTFTAKASASTNVQFTIGANASATATNLAAKINGYTGFAGVITAVSVQGVDTAHAVITITATQPGIQGNFLPLSAGNLSNYTATGFAHGTAGTVITSDRS